MPKLGEYKYLLDTVFFLYPSSEDARLGRNSGGSGFFVGLATERWPTQVHHIYAVTNWHVACQGSSLIRVNSRIGPPRIFELEPSDWIFLPRSHDIAVIPVSLNPEVDKAEALDVASFIMDNLQMNSLEIDVADDLFMVGRFIDYDGSETNQPALRFGHVSIMSAAVKQPTGYVGPSIVADLHSRTGFSGSPVFVYRTHGSIFAKPKSLVTGGHLMKLLGILWASFPSAGHLNPNARSTAKPPRCLR